MWNGINRRKFPRVHYQCTIGIHKEGEPKTIATKTENIGEGGICVLLEEDLGLFKGVNLELELEDSPGPNIRCSGTVVWVVKRRDPKDKNILFFDTGIEFVDIDEPGRERIAKIVEKLPELP